MNCHFTPTMMTSAGEEVEELEPSLTAGGKVKWCGHCGKFWLFLKKFNIELPYVPAISLLGTYPREMKTYVHTDLRITHNCQMPID